MARVVVAMSGGVDSSVAAALLVAAGHEVIGVTLNVWPKLGAEEAVERPDACCSLNAVEDARRVADHLGIPHYVLNFREVFAERVIANFVAEYQRGRTPNPCIRCNEYIKFSALLHRVIGLDCDYIATGHYARVAYDPARDRYVLRRAVDAWKDQSYVLYVLTQDLLARTLFPIGDYPKSAVRDLARQFGLPVASKPESQEICFIPDKDYGSFIERYLAEGSRPGPILDREGRELGQHRGIIYYTVGQRRGLGLSGPRPYYVIAIDPVRNAVIVGHEEDLYSDELLAEEVNWVSIAPPTAPITVTAKIRYRAPEVPAVVTPRADGTVHVRFARPQKAVTPGQAVVFYQGDELVGGGTIAVAARHQSPATPAMAGQSG